MIKYEFPCYPGDDVWYIEKYNGNYTDFENKQKEEVSYHYDLGNDFYKLCGSTPLLPRFALGNWWSRFYRYTQEEYLNLMDRFASEEIPLSAATPYNGQLCKPTREHPSRKFFFSHFYF